jgi:hypothetical protein
MGRRREVVKVAGCLGNRKVRGIRGVRRWMRNGVLGERGGEDIGEIR